MFVSAWVLVIAGGIIWLIGQRIPPPKNPASIRLGWMVSVLGAGIFVIGAYAGLRGPVHFGSLQVRAFSFAHAAEKSHQQALNYARNKLQVSSAPAPGWHGASKKDLECVVINKGNRKLTSLTFTFMTADNVPHQVKVRGPYPANAKKSVLVPLPPNALKSYFTQGMNTSQISGAAF